MHDFEIKDLNSRGEGVARLSDGKVVFVAGAWPGEHVQGEIFEENKSFSRARLLKVTKASDYRKPSPCVHHGFSVDNCGGCPWITVEYSEQIKQKSHRIKNLLTRLDLENLIKENLILESPKNFEYRGRARFHLDKDKYGFHAYRSKEIVNIDKCQVLSPELKRQYLWSRQNKNFEEEANEVFVQANQEQNIQIKSFLKDILGGLSIPGDQEAIELFCGSGNFSEVLSRYFKKVFAFENNKLAVAQLKAQKIAGLRVKQLDLYRSTAKVCELVSKKMTQLHSLFLNPPRTGCREIAAYVQNLRIPYVFYLSCDLATLERDAKILQNEGYQAIVYQAFDMFPHTPHVESLMILRKI